MSSIRHFVASLFFIGLLLATLLVCTPNARPAVAAPAPSTPRVSFARDVLANFAKWDTEGDGTLSAREIDNAIAGTDAEGTAAAALVTLRRAIHPRSFDPKMPSLTREVFLNWSDDVPADAAMDASFSRALQQISSRPAALFPTTNPAVGANLSCMRQGQVGDCFFIAPTGAFTFRDPAAVEKMIHELPDHAGYHVTFANGQSVDVPLITDAQYAYGASTRGEGLWLTVLEQAYGRLKMPTLPAERQSQFFTDALTRGGMSKNVIALYTGHATHAIVLRSVKHSGVPATQPVESDNDQANKTADLDAAGRNRADLAIPSDATVVQLRAALIQAMAHHRLVTAGGLAKMEDMPPDMSANHVYAIVGYDAQADIIQIWNPHGQDFAPKGPDGLRYGYTTHHGRFDVPTKEMVQVFRSATFETDEPAPRVHNAQSAASAN